MYLRFVVGIKDEHSDQRQGILIASALLSDSGQLYPYEEDRLKQVRGWFNQNLEKPESFTRSSSHNTINKAISWFKDTATECISRMYDIKAILEAHGYFVDVIKTDNPGYIVYEDKYQITAEPFQSTVT